MDDPVYQRILAAKRKVSRYTKEQCEHLITANEQALEKRLLVLESIKLRCEIQAAHERIMFIKMMM